MAGAALSLFHSSPTTVSGEAPVRPPGERPTLAGLGTRVEQIIRLAEKQADDHRATAEREAERLLSEARSAARLIVDRARADAAGLTGAAKPAIDRAPSDD